MRRRQLMEIALVIAAACFAPHMLGKSRAEDKMTREQAKYQEMPKGIYSCALCSLFEPPESCKVVEGDVSKNGWCRAFALAH